jgi:ribonucleotide reductase beta subunit family protein with ferritin-like domain
MIQLDKDLAAYNKGRRDEQKAIENVLEVLTLQGLLDPATLNLLIEEMTKIDRRPRREEK